MRDEQTGFRKGRSTNNVVFTEKLREFIIKANLEFICFNNLNNEKLWIIVFRQGYPPHLINVTNTEIVINTEKKVTK